MLESLSSGLHTKRPKKRDLSGDSHALVTIEYSLNVETIC